ncbi:hypothetical protein BDZ97DRAFT_524903 [Flammula alnicola]|nr:hypothetical protein BDZ97DRAFT_524903 [Flammula alnicola]
MALDDLSIMLIFAILYIAVFLVFLISVAIASNLPPPLSELVGQDVSESGYDSERSSLSISYGQYIRAAEWGARYV